MKRMAAVLTVGLIVSAACGQYARVWTQPTIPTPEVLDRLNLRLGWTAMVPVAGFEDGVATIQNLGDVVIVQTRRGGVSALDPTTGAARWQTAVGLPYPVVHRVGFNETSILVANGARIYALDRATGKLLWNVDLAATPSSPPTATGEAFYVCLSNGRLSAYAFPNETAPAPSPGGATAGQAKEPARAPSSSPAAAAGSGAVRTQPVPARPSAVNAPTPTTPSAPAGGGGRSVTTSVGIAGRSVTTSVQVTGGRTAAGGGDINRTGRGAAGAGGARLLWDHQTNLRISERPIVGEKNILVVGTGREAVFLDRDGGTRAEVFRAESDFTAPVTQYFDTAYAACANGTAYAFDLNRRSPRWEITVNGAVIQRPVATDEDLFVASEHGGVTRLVRATGQLLWQNPAAVRFVASNPKFVYARDTVGRLLILDKARGTTLTSWDARDFTKSATNAETDRLILAADDGRVISLHDRAYPQPVRQREAVPPPPPPPASVPPAEERPAPQSPKPPATPPAAPKPPVQPRNPPVTPPPTTPPPTTPPAGVLNPD
jgi:outer membrane protein assembly factor BamB